MQRTGALACVGEDSGNNMYVGAISFRERTSPEVFDAVCRALC